MATYEAKRYDFSGANITALNGSNVASGTVAAARIADLATSKITSGTFADARISSSSVTAHVSAVTEATGTWTPSPSHGGFTGITGNYARIGNLVYAVAHGGWSSQTGNSGTGYFNISGLPITPRSGSVSMGMGTYHFYNSQGTTGILNVLPADTTMRLFQGGSNLSTTSYDSGKEKPATIHKNDSDRGGNRFIEKNMHQASFTDTYWQIFVVYQV